MRLKKIEITLSAVFLKQGIMIKFLKFWDTTSFNIQL